MIKRIMDGTTLIAIIGSLEDVAHGNNFVTEPELPMQLGFIRQDKGKIQSHIHKIRNQQMKSISNEFHFVVTGKAVVSLFNYSKQLVTKIMLVPGMFCLLFNGGHGYEIIKDDTIIVEVKNGAFQGVEIDKEKF